MNTGFMNKFLEVRRFAVLGGLPAGDGRELVRLRWRRRRVDRDGAHDLPTGTAAGGADPDSHLARRVVPRSTRSARPPDEWLICKPACPAVGPTNPTGPTLPLTAADVGATIEVSETANDTTVTTTAHGHVRRNRSGAASAACRRRLRPRRRSRATAPAGPDADRAFTGAGPTRPPRFTDVWERAPAALHLDRRRAPHVPTSGSADVGDTIEFIEAASNARRHLRLTGDLVAAPRRGPAACPRPTPRRPRSRARRSRARC